MSTHIKNIGELEINTFAGGVERGKCVQISEGCEYIQFPVTDIDEIIKVLEKIRGKKK